MMMIIKILPKHLLPVHHQNGCSHSRRSITSKIICIFVSFLKFYRIFFLFFFSLKWNFSFYISITQCVLLIDVVQYRRYSSCVSFQCTKSKTDYQVYPKCPSPAIDHLPNNTPPFNPAINCSGYSRLLFQDYPGGMPDADRPYRCWNCGKLYTHKSTLKRHRETVCGKIRNTNGKWKCLRCPRSYRSEGNLERHLRYECGVARQFSY